MDCVAEGVTLLAVNVVALGCPRCTMETVGEDTLGMNALSCWSGFVEIGVGACGDRGKVMVFEHGGRKILSRWFGYMFSWRCWMYG